MSNTNSKSEHDIILIFFNLQSSLDVSQKVFEDWLNEEYVPALSSTAGIETAWLYTAANPDYHKQQLVVCRVSDLSAIQAEELPHLVRKNKLLLFKGFVDNLIECDLRIYSFVQLYETSKHTKDVAPCVMLAMMQPGEDGRSDLDAWYRDEHNQQMSEQPGWWRTTRFSFLRQHVSGSHQEKSEELSFLAIHEFGNGNQLGTHVQALEPISDWTKRVMSNAIAIDAAIYHKQRALRNVRDA